MSSGSVKHLLVGAAVALLAVPSAFGQAAYSADSDADAAGGVTSSAQSSDEDSRRLAVNPFTGQTSILASSYSPLTRDEMWKLYIKQTYTTMGAYFAPVVTSLVDQASGQPRQWGTSWAGFGKRLGSRVASDDIIENTIQYPMASLLQEDVRYIASGQRGPVRRLGHAIVYTFLTYNTQGQPTLNIANFTGSYVAAGLSSYWMPGHHKTLYYGGVNGSEGLVLGIPGNVVQEFWPEISGLGHKLLRWD